MSEMFRYCFSNSERADRVTIDFSEAIMGNVTNMNSMFYYFIYQYNGTSDQIDIKWDNIKFTNSLTDMSYMFYYSCGIT
jgi:hypothetical protein